VNAQQSLIAHWTPPHCCRNAKSHATAPFGDRAGLAQLVEHLICNQGVRGSSPLAGTNKINMLRAGAPFRHDFGTTLERRRTV
jgi:hypothetical protein